MSTDNHHNCYWAERVICKNEPFSLRIEGAQYIIGKEGQQSRFKGFGGRTFYIRWNDGRYQESSNLWFNGLIPEEYLELLPDNAEFVTEEEWTESW